MHQLPSPHSGVKGDRQVDLLTELLKGHAHQGGLLEVILKNSS
jgi:hypothetical protein